MKILLAEDEPDMAGFIARGLADEDYAVDIAATGGDAFSRAVSHAYDLLILDRKLPGKDGLAVCRELRAQSVRVPVLMLTALGNASDVIAGLNCARTITWSSRSTLPCWWRVCELSCADQGKCGPTFSNSRIFR